MAASRRLEKHESPYDSDFFRKLIELQNEVHSLTKECESLREDGKRRQASYLRRESQLQLKIDDLKKRQENITNGADTDDDCEAAITSQSLRYLVARNAFCLDSTMRL